MMYLSICKNKTISNLAIINCSLLIINYLVAGFQGLLFFLLISTSLSAQETVVVGQIMNRTDKSPVASVNIFFKNTNKGAVSNEEGYFMIRSTESHTTLVFSAIGYRRKEMRIKQGQSVGLQIELDEENQLLQEVFILPGMNPALGLMKKVRLFKNQNDISRRSDYIVKSTEQNLVLLNKITQRSISKRLFEQLRKGALNEYDSALVVPLYMSESQYRITSTNKKQISKNTFDSPVSGEKLIGKLLGEIEVDLNFYDNAITVLGKSLVSPLSNVGNAYYNYFLADSTQSEIGKQYEIHFRTKNSRNLAFNGRMGIDSATYALTSIEAELPAQANINFIHNLRISQEFAPLPYRRWTRKSEEMALNMNYELLADSLHPKPEIFVKRSATFQSEDSLMSIPENFAQSDYTQSQLNEQLNDLSNTPMLRTAKWLADVVLTGYVPVGKIDIGRIQQIMRITDIEGLRVTLPLRTNEKLWKNFSLGGYAGYGFKNDTAKYSGFAQFRLPGNKRRVFSLNYTNDYRRVDYNYNDFMYRENPLVTGDTDISNSFFALESVEEMSERNEFSFSFSNDWNPGIESNIYLRYNRLFANASMPMVLNGAAVASFLQQQSATFSTRFSFDERTYDDHMQRIYIANKKPVIYSILEIGKYQLGNKSGPYAKFIAKMKQDVNFNFAQLSYIAEAGLMLGNVPYPLLQNPLSGGSYSLNHFSMMNFMEYATDKYITIHSDLTFNGVIMNQIPFIQKLNLREMCSFNMAYGGLSDSHKTLLDYPAGMNPLSKPYMEVGVGLSNILHIFTLQSVWRLTDLNRRGVVPWGLRGSLRISF